MSRLLIRNNLVPPLLPHFYKGQLGKIAVIGGSEDYSGAPFFSAHAAMLAGIDLVHVICEDQVAPVIKGYSPDLMVHPYLKSGHIEDANDFNIRMDKVKKVIERMDTILIGPGLGRDDPGMFKFLYDILEYSVTIKDLAIVLDADALWHLTNDHNIRDIIAKSKGDVILTPNLNEFKRLMDSYKTEDLCDLSNKLKVVIVQKGGTDYVCNGVKLFECDEPGSMKRVGGQGDTLGGIISAFLCWTKAYKKGLYKPQDKLNHEELIMLACQGGCLVTRMAAFKAFNKYGRGMLTSNLHEFIAPAIGSL